MEHLIAWCGFLGGWLLVAGPISQAVQELTELELERERIAEATSKVERPPPVSVWWWLLPPAKMYLEHRRNDAFRETFFNSGTSSPATPETHAGVTGV